MSSPSTIDLDLLVAPFEGDSASGVDPRSDTSPTSDYYSIKDARQTARNAERSGALFEGGTQVVAPEWRTVCDLGLRVLSESAKDLEIAAWVTESLVRQYGFAGLRDGFRLMRELTERFWDGLYPMPDEDGMETRVAPVTGLNGGDAEGTLVVPIALTAITEDWGHGPFSVWRYKKVRDLSKSTDEAVLQAAAQAGTGTLEQCEAAVRQSSPDFLRSIFEDAEAAVAEFRGLTAALDERCGADSPPSTSMLNLLEETVKTVRHMLQEVGGLSLESGGQSAGDQGTGGQGAGASGDSAASGGASAGAGASSGGSARAESGEIRTRDDAFRLLGRVAEFFRQTEPHSPLASLLNQAVRWGRMPLEQLVEELIPDPTAREHFGMLTGMRKPPEDGNS